MYTLWLDSLKQKNEKMKKRNPLAVFFLGIITFGIYDLYWLVVTKKVLNEKTKHHTPTIWLLILPAIMLTVGYAALLGVSISDSVKNAPNATTQVSSSGEQVNTPGTRRPEQYIHRCRTTNGQEYVTQGNPKCLPGDNFVADYDASVAGTVYSSPCSTTGGTVRYVYVARTEACPTGTKLLFYNSAVQNNTSTIVDSSGNSSANNSNADSYTINSNGSHAGLAWTSLGLIFVGYLAFFAISIFWFFRFSQAVDEYTAGKMSTAVSFLTLWLIHLIGVALIQDAFNNMDERMDTTAAAPASGPAPALRDVGMPQAHAPASEHSEAPASPAAPDIPAAATTPAPMAPASPAYADRAPQEPPADVARESSENESSEADSHEPAAIIHHQSGHLAAQDPRPAHPGVMLPHAPRQSDYTIEHRSNSAGNQGDEPDRDATRHAI